MKPTTNALENLRKQLAIRAEEEKKRQVEELAAKKEAAVFQSSVGAVTRIKTPDTYIAQSPIIPTKKPKEIATMSEAMQEAEQWSDEFDGSQDSELCYLIKGGDSDVLKKLRKGQWPAQAFLDLHGMQRDQARVALAEFLRRAKHGQLRSVCVIHGKGINSRQPAVLPAKVRSWLSQSELVQAFCPASPSDGGDGAVHVLLITKKN